MAIIIWSPAALDDVDAVAEFIARDSRDRAALFIDRLITAVDRLETYPYSGRVIPEIGSNDCREIIYGAYRIMYKIVNDEVWITGVIHGARDWKP
jgi:plasmid stabilization system protein ParE